MNRKLMIVSLLLAIVTAACTGGGDGTETTTTTTDRSTTTSAGATPSSTITPDPTSPTPTFPATDRQVEQVDCDDATDENVIVCEAYDLIKERYVDEIDDAILADAATTGLALLDGADTGDLLVCVVPSDEFTDSCEIAGAAADDTSEAAEAMVAGLALFALDPNSAYFDPTSLDLLQEEQQGEVSGIGALVSSEDPTITDENQQCGVISETCNIFIVSTIEGAPAEEAGLMRDDVILEVDGQSILGWTIDEVTAAVRGPSGTDVTLTMARAGEQFEVTITRSAVSIPVIETEVFGEVGYVRLRNFTGNADAEFETAIVDVLGEGVDELVVDLRDNPGGFLTTAIDVTSVFMDQGDVVVTQSPNDKTSYPVTGTAIVPEDMEVTFVLNRGSASASEVVSAALQEAGRASVAGESSFGKNTVQQRFTLSNGGALKLTIARWLTPEGHDFGGTGVTPDLEIENVTFLDASELVSAVTGA